MTFAFFIFHPLQLKHWQGTALKQGLPKNYYRLFILSLGLILPEIEEKRKAKGNSLAV
jgi:hypothetical protein